MAGLGRDLATGSVSGFAPFDPLNLADLDWFVDPDNATVASGTDTNGLYRVTSVPLQTDSGNFFVQATASAMPALGACKNGQLRMWFETGNTNRLVSDRAKTNDAYLHSMAQAYTIYFGVKIDSFATSRRLFNTKTTPGSGTGLGVTIGIGGAEFRCYVGNGTANFDASGGDLSALAGTFVVCCITFDPAAANEFTFYANDPVTPNWEITIGAFAGSGSDPGVAITLGATTTSWLGFFDGQLCVKHASSATERAAVMAYLAARWGDEFASYEELAAEKTHMELRSIWKSNGSAYVDLCGQWSLTEFNAPTHGTDADYNNQNVMTMNGTDEYLRNDSVAADITGQDVPFGMASTGETTTFATNRTRWAFSNDSGATTYQNHRLGVLTTDNLRSIREDDPDTGIVTESSGTLSVNTPYSWCHSFWGTTWSTWQDITEISDEEACNVDTLTLDTFSMGCLFQALAGAQLFWSGVYAVDVFSLKGFNACRANTLRYLSNTWFGVGL